MYFRVARRACRRPLQVFHVLSWEFAVARRRYSLHAAAGWERPAAISTASRNFLLIGTVKARRTGWPTLIKTLSQRPTLRYDASDQASILRTCRAWMYPPSPINIARC